MKDYLDKSEGHRRNWSPLAALLLLAALLSGCYLTQEAYQVTGKLTQPLPYRFLLHADDQSTDASLEKFYVGQATERAYEISSSELIRSLSFEQLDQRNRLFWAQMHLTDASGEEAYANYLMKIDSAKALVYLPSDTQKQISSRDAMLQALRDKNLLSAPVASYSIYDLRDKKDKATAEALLSAQGNPAGGDAITSLDTPASIDLTQATWRASGDDVGRKLNALDSLSDEIKSHGFTRLSRPHYRFIGIPG